MKLPKRPSAGVLLWSSLLSVALFGGVGGITAKPSSPMDESRAPHYYGPYPNWANSPFRLPDIDVQLNGGGGSGAKAAATVDPVTGAVTSIDVTESGTGYTSAPTVDITSPLLNLGKNAAATAVVDYSGTVTAVTVSAPGAGYSAPSVSFSGGGAGTNATATAFGGVDAVTVADGGTGYTFPTVEFGLPNDPNGTQATGHATMDANGAITAVIVDQAGSGYSAAPSVTIHDGTVAEPVNGATPASATATLAIQQVKLDTFGSGYTSAPTVSFTDTGAGAGASATAEVTTGGSGAVTAITVTNGGQDYMTPGIKKFTDALPGLCTPPDCPATGKYIPLAVPEVKTYNGVEADEYVIGLVQYRTRFSSSLPDTLVRGYVQIETPALYNAGISRHYPLTNADLDPGKPATPVLINGVQAYAVTPPQWLGPTISATKDRPVRVVFHNLLPTGSGGDLFLPTDSGLMGAGNDPTNSQTVADNNSVMDAVRNPACGEYPKPANCFKDNRAAVHLHGGLSPWINDGTPHQWITPAGENTQYPQGVSVSNVPDMNVCTASNDGCATLYYTNQQSARLLFYHDHAWGTTRLNVYAGEAAGYLISDATEQGLINSGTIPAAQIPLVVQDRTFVPDTWQLYNQKDANNNVTSYGQDPTWDTARWGGYGNLWYHHVYMPAQNPGDPSGMSAYGRWMYGPWFWPPANPPHGPIANPYYNPACNLDDPATWQYQTDPFCEPAQIPGTPNISVGMEQFNDTPMVNGVAYPTVTLEPKAYRLRILNAANDRFFNFQWYVADPTTGTDSEVALKASEVAAAQLDPNVFPTPDTAISKAGPDWIQIGNEAGFLPAPAVIDGQQVTTWITDPTRFDVGNVDQHSLLVAPAERADVIVDFSQFAGKTLILYNDAPAAFPARVASYDYYTGAPDLRPVGAPTIVPGFGPNTRTVMQVKIAGTPAPAFNLTALQNAFKHNAGGTGVFESGQHPIIVGQAAYNSAYGTGFPASSNCNVPGSTLNKCDGIVRIHDGVTADANGNIIPWKFNTLLGQTTKMAMPLQPKAIHDEMNSTSFDEFGRMQANLGVEALPPTPGAQNVTLYPFINPQTEIIDGTVAVTERMGGIQITPITSPTDGSQLWRITHNGVDTHPIHFHLFDVQVINRVTWDNIVIPPDANELGWKDTVRISPLEDTIVALRPVVPDVPFELPNAIRPLNPMAPIGNTAGFNSIDPQGSPTNAITNQLVNFGWEYVYHCHILSHEEMDMMRPMSLALPPLKADGLVLSKTGNGSNQRIAVAWNDNSINETGFALQRSTDNKNWTDVGTSSSPLGQPNTHGTRSLTDTSSNASTPYLYRVAARNTVGYGNGFPQTTVESLSPIAGINQPAAPTNLAGTLQTVPQISLSWRDNATNETGFTIERSTNGGAFAVIGTAPARTNTGNVTYVDTSVKGGATYTYRVAAVNVAGTSAYATSSPLAVPAPPPVSFAKTAGVGTVTQSSATAGTVAFGNLSGAQSSTITFTNNTGAAVSFGAAVVTNGTGTAFSKGTDTCSNASVAAGGTCSIQVNFAAPSNNSSRAGTLSVPNAAGNITIGLSGS